MTTYTEWHPTTSRNVRDALLLGWETQPLSAGIGFREIQRSAQTTERSNYEQYCGDGHLLTIAPTRSGKGRGVIIPNLLTTHRPVIVVDPKGENYQVTARYRRKMGHTVIKLDPFGQVGDTEPTDSLNIFDLFDLDGVDVESEAQMLAELLSLRNKGVKDPFWDVNGGGLLAGVLATVATVRKGDERVMNSAFDLLMADDTVYGLAQLLDTVGKEIPKMAYREIASFLQLSERDTRPGVMATAQSYIKSMLAGPVLTSLRASTFTLQDVVEGKPIDIFLILPADKLRSHAGLLRLWIGTLLRAITSRRVIPANRTLMLIDEAGQLGEFVFLETILTLCAGFGVQCWTFWQSAGQILSNYGNRSATILDNCDVVQAFGLRNGRQVDELSALLGSPHSLIRRACGDQIYVRSPEAPNGRLITRADYLNDPLFVGRFDTNGFFDIRPTR